MKKDNRLNIRISSELKQRLEEAAKKDNRTLGNYVTILLEKELNVTILLEKELNKLEEGRG